MKLARLPKVLGSAAKMAPVAMMAAGLLITPTAVLADSSPTYQPGTLVTDNFHSFVYQPNAGSYWFTENRGEVAGQDVNSRETACAIDTCVHLVNEGVSPN